MVSERASIDARRRDFSCQRNGIVCPVPARKVPISARVVRATCRPFLKDDCSSTDSVDGEFPAITAGHPLYSAMQMMARADNANREAGNRLRDNKGGPIWKESEFHARSTPATRLLIDAWRELSGKGSTTGAAD